MSKVHVELYNKGVQDLLKGAEMQSVLEQHAREMNLLYDGVKVYKFRAAIHEKGDTDDDYRKDN